MRRFRIPSPSLPDLVFLVLAVGVPIGLTRQLLSSDGDLGRHIRVGEYILSHGLLHQDIFSFTRLGQPFVGYEWLSEALTGLAYRLGGLPLVAVASGIVIGLTYWIVTRFLIREGVDPLLAYLVALLAAVLGSVHWLARPHLFTMLGVAVVMSQLERGREGGKIWSFVPIFALWANLHGGFLFGLILIGTYAVGDLAEVATGSDRKQWLGRARHDALCLAAGAFGTLLTPYGIHLPLHVLGWFRNRDIIDHTGEYLSPDFHNLTNQFVLLVLVLVLGALALSKRRPTFPRLFVVMLTVATALIYQRNIPLMGLAALPALALHIDPEWRALRDQGGMSERFAEDGATRRNGPWAIGVSLVLLLLTLHVSPLSRWGMIPGRFDPKVFPVAATAKAREAGLTGRIYNDFIWGGYMLLEWPEQKVFIDGQTDFYGEDLMKEHGRIALMSPGWRDLLRKWDVSLVMIPGQRGLAHELVREPIWRMWYCDSTAVILRRDSSAKSGFDPDTAEARLSSCAPRGAN